MYAQVLPIRLVLTATAVADETVQAVQRAAVVVIGDEELFTLLDVLHGREGHHLPAQVPGVLGVPPGMASVVEIGRNGKDALAATCKLEAGDGDRVMSVSIPEVLRNIYEDGNSGVTRGLSAYWFVLYFWKTGFLCTL